jgi:hypothetical protein
MRLRAEIKESVMSRNGSGIYSLPAGSAAVNDAIIDPVAFNTLISDLESDANTARPIVAGGTGATTAAAARTAFGAPPLPQTATGAGQWVALTSGFGNALNLPSGGTWVFFFFQVNSSGNVVSHNATVAAGGASLQSASAGINGIGFAWRIS